MDNIVNKIAREIAWTVGNAIIDSGDEELGKMTLNNVLKIRDITEQETKAVIKDMIQKNKEVNSLLNKLS